MYHNDHGVPHFHATYGDGKASISIEGQEVLRGDLPPRAVRLVRLWARLHREELLQNWTSGLEDGPFKRIEALS